jgi:hypothetical protein
MKAVAAQNQNLFLCLTKHHATKTYEGMEV